MTTKQVTISNIRIENRIRRDHGDLQGLAESMAEGVLQPIGITRDKLLVFGERRLLAARDILGWEKIPARIVDVQSVLHGQFAENLMRKEYTVSERVAIVEAMRSFKHGGDRRSKQVRKGDDENLTVDEAAKRAGLGGKDGYFRAKRVIDKAVPELVKAMDAGRLSVSASATLAEAEPEEQTKCLTKPLDEGRWTAKGIERELRRVRIAQAEVGQLTVLPTPNSRTRHGKAEIWCGDCVSLMKERIKPKSVEVVVMSPPYNVGIQYSKYFDDRPEDEYLAWLEKVFDATKRVLKDDGSCFLNVASTCRNPWKAMHIAEVAGRFFNLQNHIIWVKSVTVEGRSHGHFTPIGGERFLNNNFEHLFHFTKKGQAKLDRLAIGVQYEDRNNLYRNRAKNNLRCGGNVWFLPHKTTQDRSDKSFHPCVFPVELPERCIKLHGVTENMLVLDPFCGTGSTIVAAERLGVKGIGIDVDPAYCRSAETRLAAKPAGQEAAVAKGQEQPSMKTKLIRMSKPVRVNTVAKGDCRDLIPRLPDGSIHLCPTSPPYAEQRKGQYPGVPEHEYPAFTVEWMAKLWDKLADEGSVLLIIDPHIKKGVMSGYVRRTEGALCDFGWKQHQTQIWYKRDRAPLGNKDWPRRCWENILWFSKTSKPFCDPRACGQPSDRLSTERIRNPRWSPGGKREKSGIARVPDVWNVPVGGIEKGIDHPAMFPVELAEKLIKTFCPAGGTVVDPFAGSGSSLVAAKKLDCDYHGFDKVGDYCKIAQKRLAATIRGGEARNAG